MKKLQNLNIIVKNIEKPVIRSLKLTIGFHYIHISHDQMFKILTLKYINEKKTSKLIQIKDQ